MSDTAKINYVEFATTDLQGSKAFFSAAFGWSFKDSSDSYSYFSKQGVDGGFYQADQCATSEQGAPLLVIYSTDLEAAQQQVSAAGGKITKPVFTFPGGKRFHFLEPGGNELAVWSE